MIFNGIHRALQPASPAVPAFDRVKNDRFLLSIWPSKNITRTDLITIATLDTLFINHRRHERPLSSMMICNVNPVRRSSTFQREGSHRALDPVFAPKGILSSSPPQAAGISNGVKA
jgi:hypothetical protein